MNTARFAITTFVSLGLMISSASATLWIGGTGAVNDINNWDDGLPTKANVGQATTGLLQGSGTDFDSKVLFVQSGSGVELLGDTDMTDAEIFFTGNSSLLANGNIDLVLGAGTSVNTNVIYVQGAAILLGTAGNLTVGGNSEAKILQTGGQVLFQNGLLTLGGNQRGEYELQAGTLKVEDMNFASITSWINFTAGSTGTLMVSNSYSIASIEANISNGVIRYNGLQAPKEQFSITDDGNYISVQAIPEPAVAGLIGIFGVGIIFTRRIFIKS